MANLDSDRRGNSPDDDGLNGLKIAQARMLDIANRVPEQLRRAGWRSNFCVVVMNFSQLVANHGQETAEKLVWPIEMAITQEGWIAAREYVFLGERMVEQIVAFKPKSAPPNKFPRPHSPDSAPKLSD
jgi:hypothetical protein